MATVMAVTMTSTMVMMAAATMAAVMTDNNQL
jgi:hypothetical protein